MGSKQTFKRVLRMRDLPGKVNLQPSTIYDLIARGRFPAPFKIVSGGRAAGWLENDIDNWLDGRTEDATS
jgi:prophage regulatory protein